MNYLVIMAGGQGTRFWPVSTAECPKQFLDVLGTGRTLLQLTADRMRGIVPPENVWVVTSARYRDLVAAQLPEVPAGQVLLEPCGRNTAPCICYASWKIKKRDPRANIIVSPSDHIVGDEPAFRKCVADALEFAAETDGIVTLGIKPSRPETGYGYIRADLRYSSGRKAGIYRVDAFKEKPEPAVAERYMAEGGYFWNAGIFIWSVSTIINAFRVYAPAISRQFESLLPYYDTDEEQARIDEIYPQCENISIDYAVMEKADEVFVLPAEFGWSDMGTWSSLRERLPQDARGNAVVCAEADFYDTSNCIVHATGLKKIVVQGLDGYIVAEKDGTLMICKLSEEQRIKLFH
ncbi:MAG: mannose-1-phosphate guanylyltransferase [Prevotellaceae bacterium]|nr:mannose-1-phosphate guanylyltransferase [Prevotellaceae bacterium]